MTIFIFGKKKLIKERIDMNCDTTTLIDRLLRVLEDSNGDLTLDSIKGECNTVMMAVSMHAHLKKKQKKTNNNINKFSNSAHTNRDPTQQPLQHRQFY